MKKVWPIVIVSLFIIGTILYFGVFQKKVTTINNVELYGDIKTSFYYPKEKTIIVHPDDELSINVSKIYTDEKGNTTQSAISDQDGITIQVSDNTMAVQESFNQIKVNANAATGKKFTVEVRHNKTQKTYTYLVIEDIKKMAGEDLLVKNPDSITVLVNKEYHLSKDYEPKDLREPDVYSTQGNREIRQMRNEAATALEKLFKNAKKDGFKLSAVSGYRSYRIQVGLFEYNVAQYGSEEKANMLSARAGESEHQTGLAMDVSCASEGYLLNETFGSTPEGKWVYKNAHRFGFIVRYPKGKEDITGYSYEPWHIRYVGKEIAKEIYKRGITYEEFLNLQ